MAVIKYARKVTILDWGWERLRSKSPFSHETCLIILGWSQSFRAVNLPHRFDVEGEKWDYLTYNSMSFLVKGQDIDVTNNIQTLDLFHENYHH